MIILTLLTILLTILLLVLLTGILLFIGAGGIAIVLVFGDLILCVLIIIAIIKLIFRKRRK